MVTQATRVVQTKAVYVSDHGKASVFLFYLHLDRSSFYVVLIVLVRNTRHAFEFHKPQIFTAVEKCTGLERIYGKIQGKFQVCG